eukprot:1424804-Lingulodinium_polyedra.AAC.1
MHPARLQKEGHAWLGALGAAVVAPEGAELTCDSGGLLDYALVSRGLVPAVRLFILPGTTWKPH